MTRDEVLATYDVVDGRIVSPGKFEGELYFVPAFWADALDGGSDETLYDGDTAIEVFYIMAAD